MTEHTDVTEPADPDARADWQERIGHRRDRQGSACADLPAPSGLRAVPGRGQVTLDWQPVPGAIGYQVYRLEETGRAVPVDHHGGDVLAVPHPPYTDTTGLVGRQDRYTVAALADVDAVGPLAAPVVAGPLAIGGAAVRVDVDVTRVTGPLHRPWREVIGSEHLSHLLSEQRTGGRPIGAELAEALRIVRDELGVRAVRAHGILCDDLGVYREVDGVPVHDFSGVDAVYDRLVELDMRPVVELSFMPAGLAVDAGATVFGYRAVVSPPRDWDRWSDLVYELARHLIDRYGIDQVRRWPFEVWNEANLDVFWSGTTEQFWQLYDVTAAAVKRADPRLAVGGPSSAAAGWVGALLEHARESGAPVDFVSTHTYGSPPLDLRPLCEHLGYADRPLLWTEWGVSPTHFAPVNDSVFAAAFLLTGMRSAAGRVQALASWVVSDHFEELGRPPALMHGGFGLLTVGNLRKPRFWALALAQRLGDHELDARLSGDGAAGLVQAWAAIDDSGRVGVLIWNATLDQSKANGDPALDRDVTVRLHGLSADRYRLRHWRIDNEHSNLAARWRSLSGEDWPDEQQWAHLRATDRAEELHPTEQVVPDDGVVSASFALPMPGISYLELTPG